MSQSYSGSVKVCARCDFWGGSREVDRTGKYVKVDSSMVKGKCLIKQGPWRGSDRQAGMSCAKFGPWGPLT